MLHVSIGDEVGCDLVTMEVAGKEVAGVGLGIGVAVQQVHVGQLEVEVVHHFAGIVADLFCHLVAGDGFANVGRCEDDRVLALNDEAATVGLGPGFGERFVYHLVEGTALQDAVLVGHLLKLAGLLHYRFNGSDGCGHVFALCGRERGLIVWHTQSSGG